MCGQEQWGHGPTVTLEHPRANRGDLSVVDLKHLRNPLLLSPSPFIGEGEITVCQVDCKKSEIVLQKIRLFRSFLMA